MKRYRMIALSCCHNCRSDRRDVTTGISVHVADGDHDAGRVLARREAPVEPGDDASSLAAPVQGNERPFLIEVLQRLATGDLTLLAG